jgi:predicted glycoside hydrolase/deacetylase ChbG (UPF0249 family)
MRGVLMIVNADDLGMSQHVNEAIFDLMAEGRVSSATLMANAPAVREAASRVSRFPRCSFGVHVNLTQFEPLTRGPGSRLLVNAEGQLSRAIETAPRSLEQLRAVYEEICAQVELVASLGVPISHLDSHHHAHTKRFCFPAFKAAQRRFAIRKVRIAKNVYSIDQPCSAGLRWKKRFYNSVLRTAYRTHTTDAFTELVSYRDASPGAALKYRSIELMVHPGHPSASAESEALRSEWFDDQRRAMRMISYHEIGT